jgi:phage shock protein PspC (stress-responsive transcriptional regulator)
MMLYIESAAHDREKRTMAEHFDSSHDSSSQSLRRPRTGRMLAGVSAGFAGLAILGASGVPLYVATWPLIPEEGAEFSIGQDWTRSLCSY